MKHILPYMLSLLVAAVLYPQESLTNESILKLVKAGISEDTIIGMINQQAGIYSVAADDVVGLKKAGISERIIGAMVLRNGALNGATIRDTQESTTRTGADLLKKAIGALGPPEKLAEIQATQWKGMVIQTTAAGAAVSSHVERITVYPAGRVYMAIQASTGVVTKIVFTSDFNYISSGKVTNAMSPAMVADYREGFKMDAPYIAQHITEYTCVYEGTEQIGNVNSAKLKISGPGREIHWSIDPTSGRLLRSRFTNAASHEVMTDYSDWRSVGGVYASFQRHSVEADRATDLTVTEYELNPAVDATVFEPPTQQMTAAFSFKVLQAESVPYVVQTGGGVSTNCHILGSTSTSFSAITTGNTTVGNATSSPNLTMNCSSSENSVRWKHVLNAMLVEASDGNAYIIACDRAWRWSKCSPLRPGDVFTAQQTDKGFVVQFLNTKQEEKEATYSVLQAKSLR